MLLIIVRFWFGNATPKDIIVGQKNDFKTIIKYETKLRAYYENVKLYFVQNKLVRT